DALDAFQPAHHVLHGRGDGRIVTALALDEHLLAGLVREARGVDDHVAALGLAVAGRGVLDHVLADAAPEHGGEDDERDPSEDGGLSVLRAPSSDARREVPGLHGKSIGFRVLPAYAGYWRPVFGECRSRDGCGPHLDTGDYPKSAACSAAHCANERGGRPVISSTVGT